MSEQGNVVAMRDALEAFQRWYEQVRTYVYHSVKLSIAVDAMRDALAVPARNCDVGTAEEQAERFTKVCVANSKDGVRGLCSETCPFNREYQAECALVWAQMPYEGKEDRTQ